MGHRAGLQPCEEAEETAPLPDKMFTCKLTDAKVKCFPKKLVNPRVNLLSMPSNHAGITSQLYVQVSDHFS